MDLLEMCDFKDKNEEIRGRLVIGILDKELSVSTRLEILKWLKSRMRL